MNSNYAGEICNCKKDCNCPKGSVCCSEKVPNNGTPTHGLCCKSGTCTDGGHCKEVKGDHEGFELLKERIQINSIEEYGGDTDDTDDGDDDDDNDGDDDKCRNWHGAFWVLFIVVLILGAGFLVATVSFKKR